MFHISLFPWYPTHLPPTTSILFKVEIIISEWGCVRHFCLPLTSVYVKLSKTRWRKPLQMEDATCITSCAVITHRRPLILLRGSAAQLSRKNDQEFGRKLLIIVGLMTHLQSRGLHSAGIWMGLIWDEWAHFRWGPLHRQCGYPLNKTICRENRTNVAFWHGNLWRSRPSVNADDSTFALFSTITSWEMLFWDTC